MKTLKFSLAVSIMLALLNVAVYAETFKIGDPGGWFELGEGWINQGGSGGSLSVWWSMDEHFANTQFDLNMVGDAFSVPFGIAELRGEMDIASGENDDLDVVAHIQLVLPGTLSLHSIGIVGVVLGPTCDSPCSNGQDPTVADITVTFPDNQVAFGVGGLLGLSLSPIVFTNNLDLSSIQATFTLLEASADPGGLPTPEPGTWALMGTGLIGLLSYGWRRHAVQDHRRPTHTSSLS